MRKAFPKGRAFFFKEKICYNIILESEFYGRTYEYRKKIGEH